MSSAWALIFSIVWAGVSQRLMLQREDQLRAEFCQQRKADKAEFAAQLAQQATLCSPDKVGHGVFPTQAWTICASIHDVGAQAPATATTPTTQQIGALHARVEAMHASELLSEAEFTAVEDCLADFIEVQVQTSTLLTMHEWNFSCEIRHDLIVCAD
eukprot:SAG31_NODE_307_length_17957_cov_5.236645_19_plen_157_part_00